jgi:ketosteroid isomerase-like protein
MSAENVEVIRQVLAASNAGDFETLAALHHPDWVGYIAPEYPLAGTWRGEAGLIGFVQEWLEAWEEFRVEPQEFIDGGDAVIVELRYWGRGRGTGMEVRDRWFYAYELRDGKVIRWQPLADREEALAVAGIEA